MTITILELLYIVLIIFVSIIWTLLTIILLRVLKILWPVMEIVTVYNKVKKVLDIYASVPWIVIDWVKDIVTSVLWWWKEKKE
jgi:hypothetical protein